MVLPTMWGLWRKWRMAVSTLWRATLAITCGRTAIPLGTMRFMGTVRRPINNLKKEKPSRVVRLGT